MSVVVDYSTVSRLVWLKNTRISPVYTWEAFLSPNPFPFLISPSISLRFPFGLRIKTKSLLSLSVNVPNSVNPRSPISSALCLFQLGVHIQTQARSFPSDIWVPFQRRGQPFPFRIGKVILCLVVFHSDPLVG